MSTPGRFSSGSEIHAHSREHFQEKLPLLRSNNTSQLNVYSSTLSPFRPNELPGAHLHGPGASSNDQWNSYAYNENEGSTSHSSHYQWSDQGANVSALTAPFPGLNSGGQFRSSDHAQRKEGSPKYSDLRNNSAGFTLQRPNENCPEAQANGPLYIPRNGQYGSTRRTGSSIVLAQVNEREVDTHSLHDASDALALRPMGREYAIARRRRAIMLQRTRHQRRAAAVAATKARVALALVRRGGTLHTTKSPEEVRISEKKQRRVSNRDSVERCRNKQKVRLINLEHERRDLERENAIVKILLEDLDGRGFIFAKF